MFLHRLLRALPAIAKTSAMASGSAIALLAASVVAQPMASSPPGIRLPAWVVPIEYDARLVVDPAQETFSGTISIRVRIERATDVVWLNANKLEISEARIASGAGQGEKAAVEIVPGDTHVIGLRTGSILPPGEAILRLSWRARFETVAAAGAVKQIEAGESYVFTQFEPLDARRVFPCFDEPAFKTPWTVTLVAPERYRAFANMPVEAEKVDSGVRETRFARSPPLPTYLVAFAVGPYEVVDGGTAGRARTPLRYIVLKGRAADAQFARQITPRIVEALEEYFDTPFPYPKLDSLTMPDTWFAMENVGLITYAARHLLANATDRTRAFEQSYVVVAAHEISHQWFGDLVTPVWWDDIWLNEAFATWMADKVADKLFPEWRWGERRARLRGFAIDTDRLATARRIRNAVTETNAVRAAFDDITYLKGAAVLTMFEDWLTPEQFRSGVRKYLAEHANRNATAEDFFAALAASDSAVLPAFRDFVDRAGVPLLDVALDCSGAPELKLVQSRFVPAGGRADPAQRWVFPACFEYADQKSSRRQCAIVRDVRQAVRLDVAACPAWVVANRTSVGYFLPRLDPKLRASLAAAKGVLGSGDVLTLLSDTNVLAGAGALPLSDALHLSVQYANDPNPRVVRAALEIARAVPRELTVAAGEDAWAAWIRAAFGPAARRVGWKPQPDEDSDVAQLRHELLPFVADFGQDRDLAREAVALARSTLAAPELLPRDTRRTILVTAARVAGDEGPALYDDYVRAARSARDDEFRRMLLAALGGFRTPTLESRALGSMLSEEFARRETTSILRSALQDAITRPRALAWLEANADAVISRAPVTELGYWPYWAESACRAEDHDALARSFGPRAADIEGAAKSLAEVLERIDICVEYRKLQRPSLDAFLRENMASAQRAAGR